MCVGIYVCYRRLHSRGYWAEIRDKAGVQPQECFSAFLDLPDLTSLTREAQSASVGLCSPNSF